MGFTDVVRGMDELRVLYREPPGRGEAKKIPRLDAGSRALVAASPFVLLGTADARGKCDVSPRGGPPGFVRVLDDNHLVVPDLNGNNILDSMTNILENPHVGMLFVLPGRDETLRVEGEACITTSDAVLGLFVEELRRPKAAIGVRVEKAFLHCGKSFRRGQVWDPASWAGLVAPTTCEILVSQLGLDTPPEQLAEEFERGYRADLELDLPEAR